LLRKKFFVDALELFSNPADLLPRRFALRLIQFPGRRAGESPLGAVYDRAHHLQIPDQFGACSGRGFLLGLPLRFEKQRRIVQNPLPDRSRSPAPGGIQLARFARIAVMHGENRRHALAVPQALPRHRHQKPHRHLRRNLAFAYLLLDRFRQKLHQCQPPPYPAHAAIEPPRQLIQAVAKTLLQLGQQPTHLQCGFLLGHSQRAF
jgi:hypothetical protein